MKVDFVCHKNEIDEFGQKAISLLKERPVLVTGGSGFVGGHLVSAFAEHYETYYTYFSNPVHALVGAKDELADITEPQSISALIEEINPRLILHAAALTNFNHCASNPEEAYKVNVQGTQNIVKSAAKIGARVINFSTDMVFDGTRSFSTEYVTPTPCCTYGKTKLAAEQAVSRVLDDFLTIRLSLVYGISITCAKCHTEDLANSMRAGLSASAYINEFRTPIFIKDVVEILLEIAFRKDVKGVLHLAGPDRLSRYELAMILVKLGSFPERHISPIASDENNRFLEPRPRDCSLKSLLLSSWWPKEVTSPETGIAAMMQKT